MKNNPLRWRYAAFDELTAQEVYDALQLRIAVFMIEQNCLYSEADGHDMAARHVLAYDGDTLAGYARIFPPNHDFHGKTWEQARIGRVVTHAAYRTRKLGHELMAVSLAEIEARYGKVAVVLSAQAHLEGFYRQHGFMKTGEPYMEDGIPHIDMLRAA
jgi:ElaA protein